MYLLLSLLQVQADPYHDVHIQGSYKEKSSPNPTRYNPTPDSGNSPFIELNVGLASLREVAMPGASLLLGTTFSNSGLVYELQVGAAFPSIATGKIGFGIGNLDYNLLFTVRPWPFFVGPQVRLKNCTFSFELGTSDQSSFYADFIGTFGFRWML